MEKKSSRSPWLCIDVRWIKSVRTRRLWMVLTVRTIFVVFVLISSHARNEYYSSCRHNHMRSSVGNCTTVLFPAERSKLLVIIDVGNWKFADECSAGQRVPSVLFALLSPWMTELMAASSLPTLQVTGTGHVGGEVNLSEA
jgi:hypothetical protein